MRGDTRLWPSLIALTFVAVSGLSVSDGRPHASSPISMDTDLFRAIARRPNPVVGALVTTASHPIVRTHPETGRKALYCSNAHTLHIEGMSVDESRPLLQYLYSVQQREEFGCRFQWQAGAVAFWDNRCAQHNPVNDYHGFRRVMHRVTLKGDVPR